MITAFAFLLFAAPSNAGLPQVQPAPVKQQLVITANASEIEQYDPLVLRVLLEYPDPTEALTIPLPEEYLGRRFVLQIRTKHSDWDRVTCMFEEESKKGCGISLPIKIPPRSFFAEYRVLYRSGAGFVFSHPQEYWLRAFVETSKGTIVSDEIRIKVGRRTSPPDLDEEAKVVTGLMGGNMLSKDLPEASTPPGKNLRRIVHAHRIVREFLLNGTIESRPVPFKHMKLALLREMDTVLSEYFLWELAAVYSTWHDFEPLAHVVATFPPESAMGRAYVKQIELYLENPGKKIHRTKPYREMFK